MANVYAVNTSFVLLFTTVCLLLTQGSFLDYDWSDGDVVFANSTCYDDQLMADMGEVNIVVLLCARYFCDVYMKKLYPVKQKCLFSVEDWNVSEHVD